MNTSNEGSGTVKTSELTKMLKKAGCKMVEHGAEHDKWFSPITNKYFRVWRHPHKEIPTGTANNILKDAGLK